MQLTTLRSILFCVYFLQRIDLLFNSRSSLFRGRKYFANRNYFFHSESYLSLFLSYVESKLKKRETTSDESSVALASWIQFCQVWGARRWRNETLPSNSHPLCSRWGTSGFGAAAKIHFRVWSPVHIPDNALFRRIRRMGNSIPIRDAGHKGDFGRRHPRVMGPRVCHVNYVK